jgi:hypothetical protein
VDRWLEVIELELRRPAESNLAGGHPHRFLSVLSEPPSVHMRLS